MNSLDLFLVQYGLAAIFIILLIKTIGIPIPIPADLIILTRTFLPGLVVGSVLFLAFHFLLGYLGGSLFSIIGHVLPLTWLALLVLVLLLAIFAVWVVVRRRQKAAQPEVEGTSLELWHEGICPVCLALYTVNQMRSPIIVETKRGDSVQST
jgi:membrane protein DedA with SNARE-associated domain